MSHGIRISIQNNTEAARGPVYMQLILRDLIVYNLFCITFVFVCIDWQLKFCIMVSGCCRPMLCISAAIAVMQCPSVCHIRELRQNE